MVDDAHGLPKPAQVRWFERLLLSALAIDLLNNLAAWSSIAARFAIAGVPPSPAIILVICLLAPLVGLLLWFLIARRRSVAARWVLAVLVAAGTAGYAASIGRGVRTGAEIMFVVAIGAEILKLGAACLLFTGPATRWLHRRIA